MVLCIHRIVAGKHGSGSVTGHRHDGVLVGKVIQAGAAFGYIHPGDVLLAIDGYPIFSDGRVQMDGERVLLNEIVERKYKGDTVLLKVWRKGKARNKLPLI